jgi:hypothetical protein
MPDELVCIGRFPSAIEAQLAKARLELEGIPTFVSHELSMGRVELKVPASAVDQALAILEGEPESAPTAGGPAAYKRSPHEEQEVRCLICQSSLVEVEEYWFPVRFLRALLISIIPLPRELFESRKRRCGVCGHRWKAPREIRRPTGGRTPTRPV